MLPKEHRLVKQSDISKTLKSRYRTFFDGISLIVRDHKVTGYRPGFRNLIVISKKIHKRAVIRNSLRRQFNSIFEQLHRDKLLPDNLDCIIILKDKTPIDKAILTHYHKFITTSLNRLGKQATQNPTPKTNTKPSSKPTH
jgi:ribonuclease P protein component